MREIFDEISLSVIRFLEHHEGVSNVQFYEIGPISNPDAATMWSQKNSPFELPSDYRAFLGISDGLLLKWSIFLGSSANENATAADKTSVPSVPSNSAAPVPLQLGAMHINSLHDVTVIADDDFVAFALDSGVNPNDGKVAFVYDTCKSGGKMKSKNKFGGNITTRYYSKNQPQIWFQDLACEWHFIASNFTEYFRLMIMHLGLPHWQYAYTRVGLDPASLQWFRFLAPDRLAIDVRNLTSNEDSSVNKLQNTEQDLTATGSAFFSDEAQEEKDKLEKQMKSVIKLNMKKVSQVLKQDDKKEKPKTVTVDRKSRPTTARRREADEAEKQIMQL